MAYIIGQYNHTKASGDDASFVTAITEGVVRRRENLGDMGIMGDSLNPFEDECITGLTLSLNHYYYFRCQIKRMTEDQTFTIKLVNYDTTAIGNVEQFIKQINVRGGEREEWVSVEFLFHPIVQFDTILFQLKRAIDDFRTMIRYPKIAYQQLSIINNIIPLQIAPNINLLKIGVQSRPGLTLCINGEEMHTSRSGIFEIKNGVIAVDFFSALNAAQEANTNPLDTSSVEGWKKWMNEEIETIEHSSMTSAQKEAAYRALNSKSFFGTTKKYEIDSFTLDYMYMS